ncbi:MAG: hypothetical protein NUV42_00585, partial [Candidatus Yonathbacteria bacterium]|nr:hypothetical protein [Candidatus Yonathbacteria bacterium]
MFQNAQNAETVPYQCHTFILLCPSKGGSEGEKRIEQVIIKQKSSCELGLHTIRLWDIVKLG